MSQNSELQEQAAKLFRQLDSSGAGKVSRSDFVRALALSKVPTHHHADYIAQLYQTPDLDTVSYEMFLTFAIQQDEKLRKLFGQIDKDKDGYILPMELKIAMEELYPYEIEEDAILFLFEKMDRDKDGKIGYDEWRSFLFLIPSMRLDYIFEFWTQTFSGFIDITDNQPLQLAEEVAHENISAAKPNLMTWTRNFLAGAVAGVVSRTCTAPLERLKILYQVDYAHAGVRPPNIYSGLTGIYNRDGFRGLFRGNLTNIVKATPDTAIRFAVFEHMKLLLKGAQVTPKDHLSPRELFVAGAVAGIVSNFCVYPLDVVKVRISAAPTGTYDGILDVFTKIMKNEGRIRPFYRGITASLCSSIPNAGLNLMTYELIKKFILKKTQWTNDPPVFLMMGVGGMSALISSTLLYPFQLICNRIIMQGLDPNVKEKDRKFTAVIATQSEMKVLEDSIKDTFQEFQKLLWEVVYLLVHLNF